ncbi:hypothetical protein, partial [Olsenella sp. An290]|uniref:hypothetical protein n=1 Tax=Olsenella sp. An290 TaxID=1965625 RepID=UPI000B55B7DA
MSEYPFDAQSPKDPREETPAGAPAPDASLDDAPTTDVRTPSEPSAGASSQAAAPAPVPGAP